MNQSQMINNSSNSHNTSFLTDASDIIQSYVIKSISALGIVFNIFSIILLLRKVSTQQIYKFVFCKFFCNTFICSIGLFYSNIICPKLCEIRYTDLFVQIFISGLPLRIAILASSISDIILLLNRYLILKRSHRSFKQSKMVILLGIFLIPTVFFLPNYFAFEIYKTDSGLYAWSYNQFGFSKVYLFYYLTLVLFEYGIKLVIIITLSFFVINKFLEFSRRKFTLTKNLVVQRREINFTQIVFGLTALNLFVGLASLSTVIILLINDYVELEIFQENVILLDFYYSLVLLLVLTTHSFEGILIIPFHEMRSAARKMFCRRFI